MTSDGKYIIILQSPKIMVFDLEKEDFKEVDFAINSEYAICGYDKHEIERSEIVICGYIKKLMQEYEIVIPMELISLFSKYYCSDTIYFLTYQYKFCKIAINDILSHLK